MAGGISDIETDSSHAVPVPVAYGLANEPTGLEVPFLQSPCDR